MKIIFDFDHCLFSTRKFYLYFEKTFLKKGIDKEIFKKTFQLSKEKKKTYSLRKHLKYLVKFYPNFSLKELKKELSKVFKKFPDFLYPEVKEFLEKWQKKADLFLISFGEKEFQREKIKKSGISHFFKKIIIVKNELKTEEIKKLYSKKDRIFFVEDNPKALVFLKKRFKNVITVRINRGEGKYKDLPDEKEIDFSFKNLKELDEILEKVKKNSKGNVSRILSKFI